MKPMSSENSTHTVKEIDQGVVTCPLMHGHLVILKVTRIGAEITKETRTDRSIRTPKRTAFVGRNILGIERSSLYTSMTKESTRMDNLALPLLNPSYFCVCSPNMSRIDFKSSQPSILDVSGWSKRCIPVCSVYSVKAASKSVSKLEEVNVVSGVEDMG